MLGRRSIFLVSLGLALGAIACGNLALLATPESTSTPTQPLIPLPAVPIQPGTANPNEPVFISGKIPFTSPFFLDSIAEPFVLLEDQAGFIQRNREFQFPLNGQAIGPVELVGDNELSYTLALPAVPQGTMVDVDNNGATDSGVQIFAVAYWSNTWGGPFLERRDGTGWSTAYSSTIVDPERDDEISGGTLVVWAPDGAQSFPMGFGDDGLLFTSDDPTAPIPSGYNIVDLNQEPFRIYKEAQPRIDLIEGEVAVNDYSNMGPADAFDALFEKVSREYPFTQEKGVDWNALYDEFMPRAASARNSDDFYRVIRDFTYAIPDAHVGASFNANVFLQEQGGSFGIVLAELSDGSVIVTEVLPDLPGAQAGIEIGAGILSWDGKPVSEALSETVAYFGPYSTEHARRLGQLIFLPRVPPDTRVTVAFQNPGDPQPQEIEMQAVVEYDSLFRAMPALNQDELLLPLEGEVLDDSGLGYIQITTFSADYNLMAQLWEHFIQGLIDNETPGLIIDLRVNGGGNGGLANDFAGYLFDMEFDYARRSYYSEFSGTFEYLDLPSRIKPGPLYYDKPVALLIGPDCVSACEGFAYALTHNGRSIVVGHFPTAGAYGEVGRGQYELPGDLSMQFPTGRAETPDGQLLLEGVGLVPDILVPVTADSALGYTDTVLEAAIQALQDMISR